MVCYFCASFRFKNLLELLNSVTAQLGKEIMEVTHTRTAGAQRFVAPIADLVNIVDITVLIHV